MKRYQQLIVLCGFWTALVPTTTLVVWQRCPLGSHRGCPEHRGPRPSTRPKPRWSRGENHNEISALETYRFILALVAPLSLVVLGCHSSQTSQPGSATFTPTSSQSALELQGEPTLLVSIEDDNGLVYERKKLSLFDPVNGDVISRLLRFRPET